ncbi:MAG: ribonuclease R [Bacteroidetes bacterium]|nr:ribonuclease R [Bacteroidota bacterium]
MATKKKPNHKSKRGIKSSLINFFREHPTESFNYKQLGAKLELHAHEERQLLLESLLNLIAEGYIIEPETGKYKTVVKNQFVEGRVDMTRQGAAFIIVDGEENDVFVQSNQMNTALNGDIVKVAVRPSRKSKRPEGEVVEIIKRLKTEFTGVIQLSQKFAFMVPDNQKMNTDIFVPINKLNGAKNGEKVLVAITDWDPKQKNPTGKVLKVLGKPGEHQTEMNSIIYEYNLPQEFPAIVEKESEAIKEEIPELEIENRWDFRTVPTFTIDPADAKDFDDALSIRDLGNDQWEVGIHIADVSYYLKEESELDKEAFERATSVYLVDRVIPMLPEKLSNNLCSLRPDEDKLCFAVVVVLDENAMVQKEWYGRTVIRSQKRFSYEEAQVVLETKEGTFSKELLTLNKLAYKLRERKFAAGAISFETEEVKFKLDENGKPLEVVKKVRKDAHKLIEDFMLLANRKVAEYVFKKSKNLETLPFVYRVHDQPNEVKLEAFAKLAAGFGYRIDTKNEKTLAFSLNNLLKNIEGKPEQNMLQSVAIRTMAKAIYTTTKTSHYGLAFDYYTHFTSPIRRYPDVMVHRLLAHYLAGKKGVNQDKIEAESKHCSLMEVRASEAERASIKYKQVEYMSAHVGEDFQGIISGVTEWGIFVEILNNKCEGMVRLSNMNDDHYIFEEERFLVRGHNTGKTYQLGGLVTVKIAAANLIQRNIDMEFVG